MHPTLQLINKAKELNQNLEQTYILLGITLSEIESSEVYKYNYETFSEYYTKELGRDKSTVSKLIKVGNFVKNNGFINETEGASYTTLYESINTYKDKEPQFVLEAAKTQSLGDIREEKREIQFGEHQHEPDVSKKGLFPCTICGKLCYDA
jgi:rubrerythrin